MAIVAGRQSGVAAAARPDSTFVPPQLTHARAAINDALRLPYVCAQATAWRHRFRELVRSAQRLLAEYARYGDGTPLLPERTTLGLSAAALLTAVEAADGADVWQVLGLRERAVLLGVHLARHEARLNEELAAAAAAKRLA